MRKQHLSKRPLFLATLAVACLLSFFSGVALAANYLGAGWFPYTFLYWQFSGPTSDSGGSYLNPALNGMDNWDFYTDIDLLEVFDGTWDVLVNVSDYGATGWTGYAYICSTNGSCDNQTAWDGTYSWCSARINTNLLFDDTQSQRQNTIMHEVGHCFSLGHRTDSTSLMLTYQTSITTPNSTDVSLINARY